MSKITFRIDNLTFTKDSPVRVMSLKRTFSILDTKNSGRTVADGRMHRDIIGTYYNYELRLDIRDDEIYDTLYELLSSPTDYHTITVPYGQSEITFDAYITGGEDTLERMFDNRNQWSGLTLKFVRMNARRLP